MNTLPIEIILSINDFLNAKDFVAFSSVCKKLNHCSKLDSKTWKNRTFSDYKVILPNTNSKFKSRYIWCYNNLCVFCSKKTSVIHLMKKVRICNMCQETQREYTLITTKTAKRELYLTDRDFKNVPYCQKTNPWNKDRPIKFFLKQDLISKFSSRFQTLQQEEQYKKNKNIQRFRRQMLYFARLYILKSIMLVKFNIQVNDFIEHLNFYTKGMFRTYISNISKIQNTELAENLFLKIRELDFLYNNDYPLTDIDYDDFDDIAKNILVHSRCESMLSFDAYIVERLNTIKIQNKAIFSRKQKLVKALRGLSYSLYDFDVVVYILKGRINLQELKLDYLEQDFIINNLDFLSLNHDTIVSKKSKKEIYGEYITKWIQEGNKIPLELRSRYVSK
jgi:hypothetical protein